MSENNAGIHLEESPNISVYFTEMFDDSLLGNGESDDVQMYEYPPK